MKFKFRLQSVFDLKKHLEEEQKDAMAAAQQKLRELEAQRDELVNKHKTWSQKYMSLAKKGMTPSEAVRIGQYLDDLRKDIIVAGRNIEKQTAEVEKQRQLLVERMKERKTFESLYEKTKERFKLEEERKEEKALEDLITSRK